MILNHDNSKHSNCYLPTRKQNYAYYYYYCYFYYYASFHPCCYYYYYCCPSSLSSTFILSVSCQFDHVLLLLPLEPLFTTTTTCKLAPLHLYSTIDYYYSYRMVLLLRNLASGTASTAPVVHRYCDCCYYHATRPLLFTRTRVTTTATATLDLV